MPEASQTGSEPLPDFWMRFTTLSLLVLVLAFLVTLFIAIARGYPLVALGIVILVLFAWMKK